MDEVTFMKRYESGVAQVESICTAVWHQNGGNKSNSDTKTSFKESLSNLLK
jgi:hypothetical protein